MDRLGSFPKNALKSKFAAFVAVCYAATNVLWATAPEAAFWSERRRALRRERPTLLASATPVGADPAVALGGLPLPAALPPESVARLPAEFQERHAGLWAALSPDRGTVRSIELGASTAPVVVFVQDLHQNTDAQQNIGLGAVDPLAYYILAKA